MEQKDQIREEIKKLVESYFDNNFHVDDSDKIGVSFPVFNHLEINSVIDSLLDLKISQGKKVKEFERNFSHYIGKKYGVAVNSGSSANLIAINALLEAGCIKKGQEVIVPSATFTTVISPIIQSGLIPVFVDIQPDTYNICPDQIESAISNNTGLIMPVHSLGCPADMKKIMKIANKHQIHVLEDCCEAHGASIGNDKIGSFGILSSFSFFVAHNMTTGEGGMVLTNDEKLDEILRSKREFGRLTKYEKDKERFYYSDEYLKNYDERYVFKYMGYNIRMTELAASMGIEQLKKLDKLNEIRVKNAKEMIEELRDIDSLILPTIPEDYFHSFYAFTILIKPNNKFSRKTMVNHLEQKGIETRAFMGGNLMKHPAYRNELFKTIGRFKNTENIENNAFFIGCHPLINNNQKKYILNTIKKFIKSC